MNSFEHHRIFMSNLIMSNILTKAEKSRCVSGFCDEYLWVYFDLSVEIWWVHMSLYYGGVIADHWIKNKDFSAHWSWPSWHVNKTESHFMPVLSRNLKPSALYKIESVKVDVLSHSVERPQPLVLFKLSLSTNWPWLSLYFLCLFHNFTKLMIIVHHDMIQVSVLSLPMQLME